VTAPVLGTAGPKETDSEENEPKKQSCDQLFNAKSISKYEFTPNIDDSPRSVLYGNRFLWVDIDVMDAG